MMSTLEQNALSGELANESLILGHLLCRKNKRRKGNMGRKSGIACDHETRSFQFDPNRRTN